MQDLAFLSSFITMVMLCSCNWSNLLVGYNATGRLLWRVDGYWAYTCHSQCCGLGLWLLLILGSFRCTCWLKPLIRPSLKACSASQNDAHRKILWVRFDLWSTSASLELSVTCPSPFLEVPIIITTTHPEKFVAFCWPWSIVNVSSTLIPLVGHR